MEQPSLNFEPLPRPGIMFSYGSQNHKLYCAFCDGPLTAIQMSELLGRTASHTRRMSDIDERLEVVCPGEFKRVKTKISKGVFEYRYIRIAPPRERITASSTASGEIAQVGAI